MTSIRGLTRDRLLVLGGGALIAVLSFLATAGGSSGSEPSPRGQLVIADLRGQALVVVDLSRPSVAAERRRIALPGGPHELVRLADGRIVSSLEQQGMLAIVELESGAVQTVELGGLPHGLAVLDGTLYVTDRSVGEVRRLRIGDRPGEWTELTPLHGGVWPHAVGVIPAQGSDLTPGGGAVLVVVSAGDDTLRIGEHAFAVSALPESVAFSPDARRVAVAAALGGVVDVVDAQGAPLMQVAVGGRPVRVLYGPSGGDRDELLAVALSSGSAVALVDGDGAVRRVEVGGVPDGLAFDASGRFLLASDLSGGVVSVIDVTDARVSARFTTGESAGALLIVAH